MKLEEKRKVIDVLLMLGDMGQMDVIPESAVEKLGCSPRTASAADCAWETVSSETIGDLSREGCASDYTEAAYRLIESSPTLRREWFGAP